MKHYQNWLSQIAIQKGHFEMYGGKRFYGGLSQHKKIYDSLLQNGFKDLYSYNSVITHERYVGFFGCNIVFIFSNAESLHTVEFSSIELCQEICKNLEWLEVVDQQSIKMFLTNDNINKIVSFCKNFQSV